MLALSWNVWRSALAAKHTDGVLFHLCWLPSPLAERLALGVGWPPQLGAYVNRNGSSLTLWLNFLRFLTRVVVNTVIYVICVSVVCLANPHSSVLYLGNGGSLAQQLFNTSIYNIAGFNHVIFSIFLFTQPPFPGFGSSIFQFTACRKYVVSHRAIRQLIQSWQCSFSG